MSSAIRRGVAVLLAGGLIACSVALDLDGLEAGCPAGTKECSGTCVPLDDHKTGCGRQSCAPCIVDHAVTVRCRIDNYECYPVQCEPGFGDCTVRPDELKTNCRTNFNEDPSNCGLDQCGNKCADRPNAKGACGGGRCYTLCDVGWGDCNSEESDGCETPLLTDPNNCGSCGYSCVDLASMQAYPHMIGNCANGACACAEGFANCNHLATDGCEAQLSVNPYHCGACGIVCSDGQTCVAGACTVT